MIHEYITYFRFLFGDDSEAEVVDEPAIAMVF